jgi:hypothetical protein
LLRLEALEDRLTPSSHVIGGGNVAPGGTYTTGNLYTPFYVSGSTLFVYGTSGNDSFDFTAGGTSNTVTLNGASYTIDPSQIHKVYFYGEGGTDRATLTDTLNKASANFYPHFATLSGLNYYVAVNHTAYKFAFGKSGDTASFHDSPGNDIFYAGKGSAGMYDSGLTYLNSATGFSINNGYSAHGGTDTARFYDSPGDDTYFAGQGYAGMFDSADTYSNYAKGFAITHGYSSQGGSDTAHLFDSNAAGTSIGGTFFGNGADARLIGYHYDNTATGFGDVEAYASTFNDFYYFDGAITYILHMHGFWEQGE